MTATRVYTAVALLVAFAAYLFLAPPDIFAFVLAGLVSAAAWEWGRLAGLRGRGAPLVYAALVALVAFACLRLPPTEALVRWTTLGAALFWAGAPVRFRAAPVLDPIERRDPALLGFGAALLVVTVLAVQYLHGRAPHASPWLLLYALSIVWVMDIGAYFSGRRFGRRKLAPRISPAKSWEGVWGGAAATLALLVVVPLAAGWPGGEAPRVVLATLLAAGASVVGDLYESRVKRGAGRKDSSSLLPGHGGVLDRIDGVLSALPVFACVWAWTT